MMQTIPSQIMEKEFYLFLQNKALKPRTCQSYINAIKNKISNYLQNEKILAHNHTLFHINDPALLFAIQHGFELSESFRESNIIGHNMYSCALGHYIQFIHSYTKDNPSSIIKEQTALIVRTEGGRRVVVSTLIERNPALRNAAIAIHGTTCLGCGFNFGETYGTYGEGYIEIHHVYPLGKETRYVKTSVATDLIPLCSNCHCMVHHKKDYVLSLNELQMILKSPQSRSSVTYTTGISLSGELLQ
ncbi:HNH endonuclease [Akkermansia glycaniphila]|uniref:HNH endonuclease n=1 Tax=Akkermansia glycaniphila TaxID=1679444 RepID=UPI001C035250|nr:HNH endonuclease [Akkermansia glycaniphila]MBT9450215.1 HNH endonuclease [Akkermansia glycaniphila]